MKKIFYMMACSALLLLNACDDNEFERGRVAEGDVISFVANLETNNVKTRTVYGEQNTTTKAWPIYWMDGDKVDVYCPQAQNGAEGLNHSNKAVFTVNAPGNKNNSYVLKGDNQEALYWGAEDNHDFYAFYPAGNVTQWVANNDRSCTITATVPSTQEIFPVNVKEVTSNGKNYYEACNMQYAIMATRKKTTKIRSAFQSTNSNEQIPLNFNPINTAVTITIEPNASTGYEINSITIANVDVQGVEDIPLAGKFQCKIGNDEKIDNVPTDVISLDPQKNIQIEFKTPIPVANGKGLKVTAFLLPNANAYLKVTVNASTITGNATTSKHVIISKAVNPALTNENSQKLNANAVNIMTLPTLPQEAPEVGPDRWQSVVMNKNHLSMLSLPGAYDSANFADGTSGCDRSQSAVGGGNGEATTVIPYMFNHGIRVFDLKLDWVSNDGGYFNVKRDGTLLGRQDKIDFNAIMKSAVQWLKGHTTEFLIFMLSDYTGNMGTNFDARIQTHILSAFDSPNDYLINFSPDITVEEARGKVLIINCNGSVGANLTGWNQNHQTDYNEDANVRGAWHDFAGSQNNVWIQDYTNAEWWDVVGLVAGMRSNQRQLKKELIDTSMSYAQNDPNPSNWYIYSTAMRCHMGRGTHLYCTNYSTLARELNKYVIDKINPLITSNSYNRLGIIMTAYVCTGSGNDEQYGQEFVNTVWKYNFVSNGPGRVPQW